MEKCEYVYPNSRLLVTNQLEEHFGDASLRYVTTLDTQPAPELHRNPSFVRLTFPSDEQSKPHYQVVFDGKDDQKQGADVDVADELTSVPTAEFTAEEMRLDGVNAQDSDEVDSDLSSPTFQPCSLKSSFDVQPSEEINQVVTPINREEGESNYQMSIEETSRKENDIHLVTGVPTECEDEGGKTVVVLGAAKTTIVVANTVVDKPPKWNQHNLAKVLYRSDDWEAEFPLDQLVVVKRDEQKYLTNVLDKGCLKTLIYKKVPLVDHQLFNKWRKLDGSAHCDSVVAYLEAEDDNFGYIVKEYFENGIVAVVKKIMVRQKTIAQDLAKFHRSKRHQTADSMSWWRARLKEQEKLKQLLNNLVIGVVNANECLHQRGLVSLNLQLSNIFVRFNCDCWNKPSCTHGSSAVTVVIGDCEVAYPVDSVVDASTKSKALKLLGPMHKYKRAEVVYDDLDLVFLIVKLLTMISGNKNCRHKLNTWTDNISEAVFTDPPVEEVRQLLKECGVPQNDTSRIISYLKVSAAHYGRMYGEHEV